MAPNRLFSSDFRSFTVIVKAIMPVQSRIQFCSMQKKKHLVFRKVKIYTHSVSLHSWKSRGSRESTSTLQVKTRDMLLRETTPTPQKSVCVCLCSFCLSVRTFLLPVGQGHLCLRAYQVCRCYPASQHNTCYIIFSSVFSKLKKSIMNGAYKNIIYIHHHQICQGVQGGHEDRQGPGEKRAERLMLIHLIRKWCE